jgi:putative ABC transport system permease protein
MAAIRLLAARLRQDLLPPLLLALLVLVTAALAASAPRLLNRVADDGLRSEVAGAAPIERNLQFGRITRIETSPGEGLAAVEVVAAEIDAGLPASVRGAVSGRSHFARSIVWRILGRPPERAGFMTLHVQGAGLTDEIRLVSGRMPAGEPVVVEPAPAPPGSVPPPGDALALQFEVALSTETARQLAVSVGDRLDLLPNPDDPLVGSFGIPEAAAIEVVGLYEVDDPAADFWNGDYALNEPTRVPIGINVVQTYATAVLSPDAYPALTELSPPMRYTFRHVVDPDRLDAGMLDQLVLDLRRMQSTYPTFASAPDPTRTTLQTGLPRLATRFLAERRTSEAVLVTAAMGPAVVALVAIGVLTLLALRRRREAIALVRGRGGSVAQIAGSHLLEGLLLIVPAAVLGAWVATMAVGARGSPWTAGAAGLVALASTFVFVGAALPAALSVRRPDHPTDTESGGGRSPRRLAFEGLVVGLAIGGVVLLRQRGLAGGSAAGELSGVDPLLAAVPALVGLAAGIVVVRLYPLPLRLAGLLASAGRGLVPGLGLRRAERQSGVGHLPLVVLLLTVAIAAFSSTMLATIDRGQEEASWQTVGAAHRVTTDGQLPADLDLAEVPGVEAVAAAHQTEATLGIGGGARVTLVALDAPEYREVTAGTPVEAGLPGAFFEPVGEERPGTTTNPIAAIVSSALVRSTATPLAVGDRFELTIVARFAVFVVSEIRGDLPTISPDTAFVMAPREILSAGLIDRPLNPTSLFVRAPASAAPALEAAVAGAGPGARVDSQSARLDALRQRPLVGAVTAGFGLALATAVGYAALAVVLALLMAGAARASETAFLRTLGVRRGQVVWLAILEHGPPVVVAAVGGLALGIVIGWVLLPGLELAAFVGSSADPPLTVDLGQIGLLTGGVAIIVVVGIVLAAAAQRRIDPALAVRRGLE